MNWKSKPRLLPLKLKHQLDSYSCKQLLKDSYLAFTLTLKVNIHSLVCGFKGKSLRTDTVNQTTESTGKIEFSCFGS